MSILDKKCYLTANISTSKIEGNTISFYNTDKNTSILYLKLKYVDDSNLDKYFTSTMLNDYTVKLAVVKPKTMELVEMSGIKENDMFKFELPTNFTDQVGKCICELIISTIDEKLTLDEFIYSVKESATTKFNAEIEPNPDLPILKQLIEQVRELINQVGSGGSGSGHVHSNKNILDTITEEKVSYWNGVINKVDKVAGKQLSTEDYTTADKQKLSNIDTSLLQPKTDNTLNTTNKTIVGAINELKSSSGSGSGGNVDLSAYQTKSDDALTTTNKTVIGSINELYNDKLDKTKLNDNGTGIDELWSASKVNAQFNTITNTALSGKSFRYLTQAEYNALSIEDKNNDNVVWCITDAEIQSDSSIFSPDGSKWILKVANDGTLTTEKVFVSAESVVLNNTSYTLNAEQTLQLTATVLPAGSNQNVIWSSSNTNVATVDSNGLVTSIGGGSAIITVTTIDGGFTANCNLTVNAPIVFTNYIYNTDTFTNPASGTHPNYGTYYLGYNVTKSIAGGVATLTKTSQINEASYLTVKHSVGDTKVYYIQVKIKTNSSGIRFGNNSKPAELVSVTNDGQYHTYSYILTDTSTTGSWLTINLQNAEINSVCEVKEIMKICLTDIYGSGNEPDLATCNSVFTAYKTGLAG